MAKSKVIELTVKVPHNLIKALVEDGYCEIIDQDEFEAVLETDQFKKKLAKDLVSVWEDTNEDSDQYEVLLTLFTKAQMKKLFKCKDD